MNMFIYWINELGVEELTTFPLESDLILPGVTRDSVLKIAKDCGIFKGLCPFGLHID